MIIKFDRNVGSGQAGISPARGAAGSPPFSVAPQPLDDRQPSGQRQMPKNQAKEFTYLSIAMALVASSLILAWVTNFIAASAPKWLALGSIGLAAVGWLAGLLIIALAIVRRGSDA